MDKCPECGAWCDTAQDEVAHTEAAHPDVIVARLRSAGMHLEADVFEREHAERAPGPAVTIGAPEPPPAKKSWDLPKWRLRKSPERYQR